MVARAGFLASLGLTTVPHASGMGEHVVVDATGRTDVPGVWAAGNVTDLSAQVGGSAAAGALAGAQINCGPRPGGRQAGSRGLPNLTRRRLT